MKNSIRVGRAFAIEFVGDQKGATAIEYALIAACLSVVIATAIGALGTKLYSLLGSISAAINAVI